MAVETRTDDTIVNDPDIMDARFFGYFREIAEVTLYNCLDEMGMVSFTDKLNAVGYTLDEILSDQYKFEDAIYKIIPNIIEMPAPLLLRVVLIRLCDKLGIACDRVKRYDFTKYLHELHDMFLQSGTS
jgi:hypothetical protein